LSKRINVGHEENVQIYVTKSPSNLKISVDPGKNSKFSKLRAKCGTNFQHRQFLTYIYVMPLKRFLKAY
jgi:hypothetical protein